MKFVAGIHKDNHPADQPENTYTDAQNMLLNRKRGAVSNEEGNEQAGTYPSGYVPVGRTVLSTGHTVVFLAGEESSEIGTISPSGEYKTVLNDPELNFQRNRKVHATSRLSVTGDNMSIPSDIRYLNLFGYLGDTAKLEVDDVLPSGGNLLSGSYTFLVRYLYEDGTPTNFFSGTLPVAISDNGAGQVAERTTAASILLKLENIDTNYRQYQIAVIPQYDGVSGVPTILPEQPITGTTATYLYADRAQGIESSLDEILIDRASYRSAQVITQNDGRLYLGNIRPLDDIDYQPFANAIQVEAVNTEVQGAFTKSPVTKFGFFDPDPDAVDIQNNTNVYTDKALSYDLKGFKRGEVYAFYVSLLFQDGTESEAFHIPGRPATDPDSGSGEFEAEINLEGNIFDKSELSEEIGTALVELDTGAFSGANEPFTVEVRLDTQLIATVNLNSVMIGSDVRDAFILDMNNSSLFSENFEAVADGDDFRINTLEFTNEFNGNTFAFEVVGPNYPNLVPASVFITGGTLVWEGNYRIAIPALSIDVLVFTDAQMEEGKSVSEIGDGIIAALEGESAFDNDYNIVKTSNNKLTITGKTTEDFFNSLSIQVPEDAGHTASFQTISFPLPPGDPETDFVSNPDLLDIAPDGKNFQFMSIPDPLHGMGFWQNENEVYPQTDAFKVFDVTAAGEIEEVGDIRGEPVRHHHMPDANRVPFLADQDGDINIMGVKFKNIKIPPELRDRVKGIRFHYAKRTPQNQRILDMSYLTEAPSVDNNVGVDFQFLQQNEVEDTSAIAQSILSNERMRASSNIEPGLPTVNTGKSNHFYAAHPFNMMRNQTSSRGVTHIRTIARNDQFRLKKFWESSSGRSTHKQFTLDGITGYTNNFFLGDRYRKVKTSGYVPSYSSADNVQSGDVPIETNSLTSIGIQGSFHNLNREEKLLIELGRALGSNGQPVPNYLVEISQYRQDMYNSFDQQELINCGELLFDLEEFNPENGSATFETPDFYGGDTFIGVYTSRQSFFRNRNTRYTAAVRHTLIECAVYPGYRKAGTEPWQAPYPIADIRTFACIRWNSSKRPDFIEGQLDGFTMQAADEPLFNRDFELTQVAKPAFPRPKRKTVPRALLTRVIRSRETRAVASSDLLRQFLAEDFLDLPLNRGQITNLTSLNGVLIVHLDRGLYRTRGREEIQTGDFRAFLGSGDIFAVRPQEMYDADTGHAGMQQGYANIVTEFGYMFVDQKDRSVFHFTREGLQQVSRNGLDTFFRERLPFNFEHEGLILSRLDTRYFDIQIGWDPVNKRYLITKRDLKTDEQGLTFSKSEQKFRRGQTLIDWDDETFETDSFTISYYPDINVWGSMHSFIPNMYAANTNTLFTLKAGVWKHGNAPYGRFYGTVYPSSFEFVDNRAAIMSVLVSGLMLNTELFETNGRILRDRTFTSVRVYNSDQDTGIVPVTYFKGGGNARYTQGSWYINRLRSIKNSDGELDPDIQWFKKAWLSNRYHHVFLEYDNSEENLLYLISAELNIKPSLR